MAEGRLHNDGLRPLSVPGFNDLPIYLELPLEDRFTHGANEWAQWPNLTARELAMLQVMNILTDKPNWHVKVFDAEITAKWREEALSIPLMSCRAWDWCLAELQDKAEFVKKTNCVLVLNTGSGVCKSDTLVSSELQAEFRDGIAPLLAVQIADKDWHPRLEPPVTPPTVTRGRGGSSRARGGRRRGGSREHVPSTLDSQVLNLVHPSLFPLVYGRTRVLTDGGEVGLDGFLNSCGRGKVAPEYGENTLDRDTVEENESSRAVTPFWTYDQHYLERFSRHFQWLPCEVEFTRKSECSVRITSYINNLHPVRFKTLYGTIEKLISLAIEPWNHVLIKAGRGRWPARIRTWGVEWKPERIQWPSIQDLCELERDRNSKAFKLMVYRIREYLTWPDYYAADEKVPENRWMIMNSRTTPNDWEETDGGLQIAIRTKWNRLHHWEHPEPGKSFTYQQWKAGQTSKAIIERPSHIPDRKGLKDPDQDHKFYSVSLQETFRERGLQVIVKIASIELNPEKPSYTGGSWHIEGMLNEHIVATAIYYYDVSNVTDARLSFRQETKMDDQEIVYDEGNLDAVGAVFAIPGLENMGHSPFGNGRGSNQELGSVSTPEGRMLTWPNTLQHRLEPFKLADETKPGHRRFIVFWLVDPHYRICSTRNVPPQQHDWWAEGALKEARLMEKGMSQEIVDMIEERTDKWPMGIDEAKELRLELMEERTTSEKWMMNSGSRIYNFCEH